MKKAILLNLVVLLVVSGLAPATTRLVPDEYATIQDAIDAAVDGDVVIVAPATYTGDGNRDIDFGGKAITVQSENGPNSCIIDCDGTEYDQHRGFYFHSGEDANSVLSGLTIKNGNHRCGGGIYCVSSSPTITNCVLHDNEAKYYEYIYSLPLPEDNKLMDSDESGVRIMCPPPQPDRKGNGAGICCVDSNSTVRNCKFVNNSAFEHGGGMYSMGGSPTLINCTFSENFAGGGGGMANLDGSSPSLTNCVFTANTAETGGGGIRNADNSNPTLTDCMFRNNSAGWSGGLGNYYSSPTLTNCTFIGNSADNNGGGINNYESNPVFRNCIFSNNSAKVGGGIFSEHNSSSTLDNCTFSANTANHGGGIYCVSCNPTITNCTFSENKAEYYENFLFAPYQQNNNSNISSGGDVRIMCPPPPPPSPPSPPTAAQPRGNGGGIYFSHCSPMLHSCTFSSNSAFEYGGAIYNDLGINSNLTNCTFRGNSASSGGGVENHDSSTTFVNCTFTDNWAEYGGGGMRNAFCSVALINCTFNHNSAGWSGGLGNYYCDTTLTNCTFSGNSAETNGGGMNNSESYIVQKNCIFSGNSALRGGGLFSGHNNSTLTNCTFSGNWASEEGGGIYYQNVPPPPLPPYPPPQPPPPPPPTPPIVPALMITNCILWDNEATNGPQIYLVPDIAASVDYSDVQDGRPGEGNIDTDPLFVEPGYWDVNGVWIEGDYHLLVDSPCIDAGDPNYIAEANETDLDGRPRVISGRIDMGAYESPVPAEARIVPRTINLASQGKWIIVLLWLPEDYNVADIDPNSLLLEYEIGPEQLWVNEEKQVVMARFSREEIQAILIAGEVELTITGQLIDGTVFEGRDSVTVIDRGGGKSDK